VVASRVYCMDVCVDVVRCEDVSWRGKGGVQSICMYVCMYVWVCVCVRDGTPPLSPHLTYREFGISI
jgi:hypothetical protein